MAKRSKFKLTMIGAGIAAAVVAAVMYSRKTGAELKEKVVESGKQAYETGGKVVEPALKATGSVIGKAKKEKEKAKGEMKETVEKEVRKKGESEAA